jgi:hypothetical protein
MVEARMGTESTPWPRVRCPRPHRDSGAAPSPPRACARSAATLNDRLCLLAGREELDATARVVASTKPPLSRRRSLMRPPFADHLFC